MLRTKTGRVSFRVRETASRREWTVDPQEHLTPKQALRVATRPELIWQFAQYLRRYYASQGVAPIEVYADAQASLNGRPMQPMVDPQVDLAAAPWPRIGRVEWIVPLQNNPS
jgi:vitamin K-dependent gamma-carboxylase